MNTITETTPPPLRIRPVVSTANQRPFTEAPVVFDTRVITGSGGGPDKTILNSPRFLSQVGYRMICGYLYPPGDQGYEDIIQKAARYQAPLISIPDRGPWDWRVITELLAVCRREKVAIWHGHDYKTNVLGLLLKQFWPMRLVTTVHGWVHHTKRTPLYYKIDQLCLPRYERVIAVSSDLYQACLQSGVSAENCLLLENAIDTEDYRRKCSIEAAKAQLGFSNTAMVVGAVGRLEPEKAFDVLIRAVHSLIEKGNDLQLVIVGEGSDRSRLENLARELGISARVLLSGWQSDVRTYFEAMDVFALSSLREGLPNVLLEAMALEVPVIATKIAGIPQLIQDGRNGLLTDPGDLNGMIRSLSAMITNSGLRDLLRRAGRRTIETYYSFPVRMQKLKMIYDHLLAN